MSNKHKSMNHKWGRTLLVAAISSIMIVSVAFAANIFGIREMFNNMGSEFPEEATSDIQQHQIKGSADGWNCVITESLADDTTAMVTITVTSKDKYLLVPTDAAPNDSAANIGVNTTESIDEYAKRQGKKVLKIGAGFNANNNMDIYNSTLSYKNVSDNELIILLKAQKDNSQNSIDAVCTVTAVELHSDTVQKVELPVTLIESEKKSDSTYKCINGTGIKGVEFNEVHITKTALGFNIQVPVNVLDDKVLANGLLLDFEGITYREGGLVLDSDTNLWVGKYNMCEGKTGDKINVRVYDSNKTLLGTLTFDK